MKSTLLFSQESIQDTMHLTFVLVTARLLRERPGVLVRSLRKPFVCSRVQSAHSPRSITMSTNASLGTTSASGSSGAPLHVPGVLMVCLGNICRSPAAEAMLRALAEKRNVALRVDSCGTGGGSRNWYKPGGYAYHVGDPPDDRMAAAASAQGLQVAGASRPLRPEDFDEYEWIIVMDESNKEAVEEARSYWGVKEKQGQVRMLGEFSTDEKVKGRAVPDPYFGGMLGFEIALGMIRASCDGLLDEVVRSAYSSQGTSKP